MSSPISFFSQLEQNTSYRLLELTPELLEELESGNELSLKSPDNESDLKLCTSTKTFKLRQMNQSNTLLLADNRTASISPLSLTAFGSITNYLEIIEEPNPTFSTESIPRYTGKGEILGLNNPQPPFIYESLNSLQSRAPLSNSEFSSLWKSHSGIEINNIACIIDTPIVHELICDILTTSVASRLSLSSLNPAQVYSLLASPEEPLNVIQSIIYRFSTTTTTTTPTTPTSSNEYCLDIQALAKWFGLYSLRTHCPSKPIDIDLFLILWRESIPILIEWPLEISLLAGNYISPTSGTIRYFTLENLSYNPKIRFQQLLSVKSSWELKEIEPFIADIRNPNVKLDSFIMKFARRKAVGKKVFVTAR